MATITFQTANTLFQKQKYEKAFEQFCTLSERKENPAFCTFMAGKCLEQSGDLPEAYTCYKQAITFDDSNAFINREIERFIVSNNLIDSNKKIILHFFPNTTNIGDSGAAAGIRTLLTSLNSDFFYYSLSCRKDTISHIRELHFDTSGIVIGGGGLFFKQPLASGWYFPLSGAELEGLSLPTVTYAIGFNQEYSEKDAWQLNESFIRQVAAFHRYFIVRSVRDYWSKNTLENEGISDIYLVPCPSAFLKPLHWFTLSNPATKKIIGISITDRSITQQIKTRTFSAILDFARWLVQHDFSPLFILHDSGDDLSLAKDITDNHFSCIVPNTAREAITLYDQCYSVVGMRGHSLILAAGRCVPFLAISYNKKIDAFMETMNLQEYCINQNAITESIDLINAFEKLLIQRDVLIAHLQNKRDIFYRDNSAFCKNVISVFLKA